MSDKNYIRTETEMGAKSVVLGSAGFQCCWTSLTNLAGHNVGFAVSGPATHPAAATDEARRAQSPSVAA